MNKELFYQYVSHPELLNDRTVTDIEKIIKEYPYFQSAHLLQLKNLNNQGSISYDRELRKSAIWITDRSKLFYLLDERVLLPIDEYPSVEDQDVIADTGETLIDFSALENITEFSTETEHLEKDDSDTNDELSQLIMSGAAQSSSFFNVDDKVDLEDFINTFKKKKPKDDKAIEEEQKEERRNKLIDTFIAEQPKIAPGKIEIPDYDFNAPVKDETKDAEEPSMITDTLAKIYIKQGKYEKALLAYEKLSLKYPEKNIYFAGQIEKIKELINNQ